jgi:hypothetical protein
VIASYLRFLSASVTTAVLLSACVTPAYSQSQYEAKVVATVEDAVSVIETVHLAVSSADRHSLPSNPIDVALNDQESILGSVAGTFASIQPPTQDMIELRDQVLSQLDRAQSDVEDARIYFHRGETGRALEAADEASTVADELDKIASRYS